MHPFARSLAVLLIAVLVSSPVAGVMARAAGTAEDPLLPESAAAALATPPARALPGTATPAPPVGGMLEEEWRYEFPHYSFHLIFGSSPAVGDAGVDLVTSAGEVPEDLEVMTGTDEAFQDPALACLGKWRLFDSRGSLEWERCTQSDEPGSSPFFSDIDVDCEYEMGGGTTSGAILQAMDREGDFEWFWPSPLAEAQSWSEYWHASAAVADVDPAEPGREVIAARYDGHVRAFRGTDGAILWETKVADGDPDCWGTACEIHINSSPAVGDIDGDGRLEIVLGTNNGTVVCLDSDGAVLWTLRLSAPVTASPALGDFDEDGDLEIVVGSEDRNVYFIDGDENGDGNIDPTEQTTYTTGAAVRSSAAIGDVDADGTLEVIVGSGDENVYCLEYDPALPYVSAGWVRAVDGPVLSSPALADRDGGGTLDVYVGTDHGSLYLLDGTAGTVLDTADLLETVRTSPAVADIDGDGKLEILIIALAATDVLYVLQDNGSDVAARSIEWGKFRHDDRNTGRYGVPYPLLDPSCLNQPPLCDPGGPYTAECAGEQTSVALDGSGSSDGDLDPLTFTWEGPFLESPASGEAVTATFQGLGVFDVTLTVEDGFNDPVACATTVTVQDTTPPAVLPQPEPLACLWPPNHWYVCLSTADLAPDITDACCEPVTWRFAGCRSDQPDEAPDPDQPDWNGDGHTRADCLVQRDGEILCVRAERAGTGPSAQDGRHYEVSVIAADECANLSEPLPVGVIHVPHDQSPRARPCLDPTKVGLRPNEPLP